ncbi:type II/IV secretion system protein [Patescibacteria group bacterium]|nr:type II/IV secretion system protein [Patescibacteria group bacterium]
MADQDFISSQVQTDATKQMQAATSTGAPVKDINRDFEERAVMERAQKMGMSYIDIEKVHINPDHLKVISVEDATQSLIVPFYKVGKKIRLAISHPTNPGTQAIIRKLKEDGFAINVNLASDPGIKKALAYYQNQAAVAPIQTENIVNEEEIESYQAEIENLGALRQKIREVTAEEALNFINVGALKTGASDIHYQPEETRVIVRFRIDGVLQEVLEIDKSTYNYISNQLKYKSGMKLNVDTIPQDGRFFFTVNKRKIDVRVSSIPTEYGESFVCRLLDSKKKSLSFEELGFEGRNLALLKHALTIPNGMILVTGPTGSGKTTTLYSLLTEFNTPDSKIITLEDPIEYHLSGITQSQINEKRGYTFGSGLRAILRQDPDIVMIGEIRDFDTAETASQAALTGHVLLSTLHTNSAIETIPRLINIGLKPFMVAPSLSIVMAQRLVRKVCSYCVTQQPMNEGERTVLTKAIEQIKQIYPDMQLSLPPTLPQAAGCDKCNNTGFLGQLSIAEMFVNDDALQDLILSDKTTGELFKHVRANGMLTMGEDGILKVLRGVTTLSEIERVTDISEEKVVKSIESAELAKNEKVEPQKTQETTPTQTESTVPPVANQTTPPVA